ncbi:hypothetical protein KAN5_15430 [Pseudoalteromonas sp. KAN5]|nr:hypothetical protein KAN5_15430 [Pseudoalteromonas sp. KAN5]
MYYKLLKSSLAGLLLIASQSVFSQTNKDSFYDYVELSMRFFTNQISEKNFIESASKMGMLQSPTLQSKIFNYQVFNKRKELAKRAGVKVAYKITEQDWEALLTIDPTLYAAQKSSYFTVYGDTPLDSIRLLKAELIDRGEKQAAAQVSAALGQSLSFRAGETIAALIEYLYALPELPTFEDSKGDFFYSKEFVLRRVISSFYLMGAYERADEYIQQLFSINAHYLESIDYPEPHFQFAFVLAQVGEYEKALAISNNFIQKVETKNLSNSAKLYALLAKAGVLIHRQKDEDLNLAADILSSASLSFDSKVLTETVRSIAIQTLLYALNNERNNVLISIKRLEKYVQSHQEKFRDADFRDIAELERLSYQLIGESELAVRASSISLLAEKKTDPSLFKLVSR